MRCMEQGQRRAKDHCTATSRRTGLQHMKKPMQRHHGEISLECSMNSKKPHEQAGLKGGILQVTAGYGT